MDQPKRTLSDEDQAVLEWVRYYLYEDPSNPEDDEDAIRERLRSHKAVTGEYPKPPSKIQTFNSLQERLEEEE